MRTSARMIFAAALALLLAGCGDDTVVDPGSDTTTVAFRDGISPSLSYYGTRDAILKDGPSYGIRNGNFGDIPADTLGVVSLAGGIYERRLLARFDLTSITSCAAIYSARLTIHVDPVDTNRTVYLYAYEATVPPAIPGSWIEGTGDENSGASWLTVDGSYPWSSPGGNAVDLMAEGEVRADTTVSFDLPADRVMRWIKYPSTNHGVLIVPGISIGDRYLIARMRETPDIRLRPELVVRYRKSG